MKVLVPFFYIFCVCNLCKILHNIIYVLFVSFTSSNGSDCNVVVPRRPSPLQAHSQASPLGHAQSPAYPMYNSPMNSMSSPQQNSSSQQVRANLCIYLYNNSIIRIVSTWGRIK